jgi:hypothetical protein
MNKAMESEESNICGKCISDELLDSIWLLIDSTPDNSMDCEPS